MLGDRWDPCSPATTAYGDGVLVDAIRTGVPLLWIMSRATLQPPFPRAHRQNQGSLRDHTRP